MAVFVELVTDAFEEVFREQSHAHQNGGQRSSGRAGKSIVRRPVRGIEIKDDTYAYLKVVMLNGIELPLLDSSSSTGTNAKGYTNFILQSVSEQRMEKHQIVETFGDSYVFFFGETPRFLQCQAILINTHDFNWQAEWWYNYENYLRGTKLVELGARCYMFWDDNVVEGFILMAQADTVADQPYLVNLSFRFFVTKYENISLHSVEQFPVRSSVQLPPGVELTQSDAFNKLQTFYRGNQAQVLGRDAIIREKPVLGSNLNQGGVGVGPLGSQSPLARQLGPGTYAFGGAPVGGIGTGLGISGAAGVGLSSGAGSALVPGAAYGFGSGAGAGVGAVVGTAQGLGLGVASGPLGTPLVGPGFGRQSGDAFAPFQSITQKIRQLPPSIVVDPSIWNALTGVRGLVDIENGTVVSGAARAESRGALRGLIAENVDEYISGNDGNPGLNAYLGNATDSFIEPYYPLNKAITRAQQISFGLPYSIITTLNALGVSADNAYVMRRLGLAPNFSPGYVASVGAFAGVSSGVGPGTASSFGGLGASPVSFSPLSNASFGAQPGAGLGVSARAGYFANVNAGSSYLSASPFYSYRDPLGAVYGRNMAQINGFNGDRHRYVEGAGFPQYGYASPYGGVGYGRAGFGDMGGAGFGSALSTGDPGFRDPINVNVRATVSTGLFNKVNNDMTVLTPGPTLGGTSTVGGASRNVGGVSSAFSLTVLEGSFSPWVNAAATQPQPLYGQPAYGPGTRGVYGPDLGYAAYLQSQSITTQTYVGDGLVARTRASASLGFF